jgi:tryptophanyl-tRNA synthetase
MLRSRVFSGMQPSGEAHLGNYLGALRQWVALQEEHECFFCIVDQHALTGDFVPADLPDRVYELAVSFLAVGLDPERSTIFVQSDVPEHTELAWLFNAVTPVGDLERMTQYKDKSSRLESIPAGLLNYPILQAADILLYRATGVPVGEDQLQHLELAREVARKWNARFAEGFFPEPAPILGTAGRILGLDGGAKMSKSMDNTVRILAEPDEVWARVRTAVTDPQRVRRDDPGRPRSATSTPSTGTSPTRSAFPTSRPSAGRAPGDASTASASWRRALPSTSPPCGSGRPSSTPTPSACARSSRRVPCGPGARPARRFEGCARPWGSTGAGGRNWRGAAAPV